MWSGTGTHQNPSLESLGIPETNGKKLCQYTYILYLCNTHEYQKGSTCIFKCVDFRDTYLRKCHAVGCFHKRGVHCCITDLKMKPFCPTIGKMGVFVGFSTTQRFFEKLMAMLSRCVFWEWNELQTPSVACY